MELYDDSGNRFTPQTISISLEDASSYYALFGPTELPSILISEDELNRETLDTRISGAISSIVRIHAFDMKSVYEASNLKEGDYIEATLTSRNGKTFALTTKKKQDIPLKKREAWFAAIDDGKEIALREIGKLVDPNLFIAYCFKCSMPTVRTQPAAAFSEYYNERSRLKIVSHDGDSYICDEDADISSLISRQSDSGDGKKEIDHVDFELQEFLDDTGISLSPTEIAAFVRDALRRGEETKDAINRCFIDTESFFTNPADHKRMIKAAQAFADRIAESWNAAHENPEAAEIRTALIDIYTPYLSWIRLAGNLITDPAQFETREFSDLFTLFIQISEMLAVFSDGKTTTGDDIYNAEDLSLIKEFLAQAKEISVALMNSLESSLRSEISYETAKTSRGKSKARKKSRPAAKKTYLINARISGIEPPIERLLLVPGNRSLGDLHNILQDAFGWTNTHLHMFHIRNDIFGEPSPDDYEPVLDETLFHLDGFSLRARSKIEYTYDFGDNWIHILTVLESHAIHESNIQTPVCIQANRACPPEDCGGIWGYEDIVAVLSKKESLRNKKEKEIVKWIGSEWSPEHCDINKINKLLEKR